MLYRPAIELPQRQSQPASAQLPQTNPGMGYRPPTGRPMPPGTPGFPGGSISPLPIGGGGYRPPGGGGGKWPWEQGGGQTDKPNPWDNMGDQTRAKYERWKNNQRKDKWTGEPIGDVSERAYYQFLNPPQNIGYGPGSGGAGGGYQSPNPIGGRIANARSEGTPAQGQVALPPQYQPYQRPGSGFTPQTR